MRRFSKVRLLGICVLLLSLTAYQRTPNSSAQVLRSLVPVPEVESNDTWQNAHDLTSSCLWPSITICDVTGELDDGEDLDWYKITVRPATTLSISLTDTFGDYQVALFYDLAKPITQTGHVSLGNLNAIG
ncbi:MAG TPA: hypothetical protein DEF47_06570, partial [Herpetosiphon sp.]